MLVRLARVGALLAAALVGSATLAARSQVPPQEPANLSELVAAAGKEGTLNVAWADYGQAEGAREIQDGIERKFHVKINIVYSPVVNGAIQQNQMVEEVRAGHATSSDLFFDVRDAALAAYAQPVDWRKYLPALPPAAMYYNDRSVIVMTTLNAIIYNTKLVPPNEVPRSFADLLRPGWKGKIASSPYQGEFGSYLGLPSVLGHDGMLKFYEAYSKQVSGIITCAETDRVVAGEFWFFGLDCGDHHTILEQRKGKPLGIIHPLEGTAMSSFAPGVPLTAPHPNAARLFIVFLLTPEGQSLLWKIMGGDSALLPGSHTGQIIAAERRKGVKFIQTYGLDVAHPELRIYQAEVTRIVTQAN